MVFAGINYIAVVVAAVAGFAVGMAWYGVLGTRWMAALGKSKAELMPDNKPPLATMAITFVCEWDLAAFDEISRGIGVEIARQELDLYGPR